MPIRILIVDDHKIIRDGLRSMIENQPDFKIVGEADNGSVAVTLADELSPDIVLMDITMPGMDGILATKEIIMLDRGIRVIGLSMHSDKRFVLRMMDVGASGYLLKDCAFEELIRGIRKVAGGDKYLCSKLLDSCGAVLSSLPVPR